MSEPTFPSPASLQSYVPQPVPAPTSSPFPNRPEPDAPSPERERIHAMSIITKTIGHDRPNGDYLEVTVEERDGSNGLSAGFSITGSVWERRSSRTGRARKRAGCEEDMGGMVHDVIEKALPQLKPIIDVHLADQSGLPMYAKENGWYFYSGGAAAYERRQVEKGELASYYGKMLETSDHDRGARTLRIPPADLPTGLDREGFEAFVDSLTERYAADAAKAREVMAAMVDGQGVEQVR